MQARTEYEVSEARTAAATARHERDQAMHAAAQADSEAVAAVAEQQAALASCASAQSELREVQIQLAAVAEDKAHVETSFVQLQAELADACASCDAAQVSDPDRLSLMVVPMVLVLLWVSMIF